MAVIDSCVKDSQHSLLHSCCNSGLIQDCLFGSVPLLKADLVWTSRNILFINVPPPGNLPLRYLSAHGNIRSTNVLERAFVGEKRWTIVIPCFWTEKSCLKLVFNTICQVSQCWRGVRMNKFEQLQILRLRNELKQEPPPSEGEALKRAA